MRGVYSELTDILVWGGAILFAVIRHGGMDAIGIDALVLFFWWQTHVSQRP